MKPLPETISSLPSTVAEEPVSRTGSGRVSPHYFAELLDQLPDAVICVDRSWQITFANAEATPTRSPDRDRIQSPSIVLGPRYPDLVGSDLERRYRATMTKRVADHLEYFYEPSGVWVEGPRLSPPVTVLQFIFDHHHRTQAGGDFAGRGRPQAAAGLRERSPTSSSYASIEIRNCSFANPSRTHHSEDGRSGRRKSLDRLPAELSR